MRRIGPDQSTRRVDQEQARYQRVGRDRKLAPTLRLSAICRGIHVDLRRHPLELSELLLELAVEERRGQARNTQPLGGHAARSVLCQQLSKHSEKAKQE